MKRAHLHFSCRLLQLLKLLDTLPKCSSPKACVARGSFLSSYASAPPPPPACALAPCGGGLLFTACDSHHRKSTDGATLELCHTRAPTGRSATTALSHLASQSSLSSRRRSLPGRSTGIAVHSLVGVAEFSEGRDLKWAKVSGTDDVDRFCFGRTHRSTVTWGSHGRQRFSAGDRANMGKGLARG